MGDTMIDASIALGVKSPQIEDPMNSYAKLMQMQNAQQQNQLGMMQMDEYRRKVEEQNALRGLNPAHPDYQNQLMRVSPTQGIAYMKERNLEATSKSNIGKTKVETYAARAKLEEQELRNAQSNSSNENLLRVGNRLKMSGLYEPEEIASIDQLIQQVSGLPPAARATALAQFGASSSDLKPTFQTFNIPGVGVQTGTFEQGQFKPGVQYKASDVLSPEAEAQKKRVAVAGRSVNNTVVKLPEQEKAFESELGKKQAGRVIDSKTAAEDAAQIMRTNQIGRDILASGAITGTGANFLVGLNNALQQAGIDAGFEDAAANSQAYAAAMGANVGRIIKQFGAGTGLSDADRQYAEQMAGGKINLTEKALKRILDINDKAAGAVIDAHNKDVAQIKTNIPLTVTRPPSGGRAAPPPAANQIPAGRTVAPMAAKTVTRTGVSNGRKVVQYSDGSIEYAN